MNSLFKRGKGIRNYLIVFFIIAFSGIPFFDNTDKVLRLGFLIFLGLIFLIKKKSVSINLIRIVIFAMFILLIQTLVFSAGSVFTYLTFITFVILAPYLALKIVGPPFLRIYRDILYVLAVIALIFWSLTNFYLGFFEFTRYVAGLLMPFTNWSIQESLIFYTVEWTKIYGLYRNPGPFHEPGAYCVFLILGIFAELAISGKLFSKKNLIFILSIFTTFSTAGYLAIFFLFSFYIFITNKLHSFSKGVILTLILFSSFYFYNELDFLNKKISNQLDEQTNVTLEGTKTSGRFLGIRKSFVVMYRHHIYGRGLLKATKPDDLKTSEAANYGWIFWISQIGIILGPLYMFFMYKSMENYARVNGLGRGKSIVLYIALLIVLGAQKHTSTMLFFMLFMVALEFPLRNYYKKYLLNSKNRS